MKVKAKTDFVSGRYSAARGETIDVPEWIGAKLISIDFVEPVPRRAQEAAQTAEKDAGEESIAKPKKTARTGKTAARAAAKTSGKKATGKDPGA